MAIHECLGVFMKLFLDNFNVLNHLSTHLDKLWLCFYKCQEFGINLNSEKNMFLGSYYSGVILGYVVSKVGKCQKTYKSIMGWLSFTNVSSRTLPSLWPPSQSSYTKQRCLSGLPNARKHGRP